MWPHFMMQAIDIVAEQANGAEIGEGGAAYARHGGAPDAKGLILTV